MKKILVVGQTPPPYGGQAVIIQAMLNASYQHIKMYHVRMCFSKDFNDRGNFSIRKVLHLLSIVIKIWLIRFKCGPKILYYPLSSAPKIALLRDTIILGCTRFLFKDVVFHFHAAGVSEELPKYPRLLRNIVYGIISKPTLGITSSEYNPQDAKYLKACHSIVFPLGIHDSNPYESRNFNEGNRPLTVMFMGLLNGTKGESYVLDAVYKLNQSGRNVRYLLAGKYESEKYKTNFESKIAKYGLKEKVLYQGVVTGKEKEKIFMDSDVFCFPSFFSSESFGIVLLEAMMYQMPVIATRWRGIQSVVDDGINGFLVDIKNADQISVALAKLYDDRTLLREMGMASRELFKEKYIEQIYIQNIENALCNL
ncbi:MULTISPECIES: glycosyltransferase family 4 protein [Bacteroides]|uniref:glycosyltransferase family 4 protein n=1 Tax=Bacteroides TaxID=816 RepID=UPI000B3A663C|nr:MULTISPECIES: glycosyltransferase family 4 protein [Bacteroides]MBM6945112.1 glycosyltransferase family 4 protein [Bacteroides gallinaceum]OUO56763.1 glycosyl transferase family 1 [Bacteroides sp. An279]